MVKYALKCDDCAIGFEGWFSSSDAYDEQRENGDLTCPACASHQISKQIMAPAIRDSRTEKAVQHIDAEKMMAMAKAIRDHVESTHEYVGDKFADKARAMYYGEEDHRPVWGETTLEEARELVEEGVPAIPLPGAVRPQKADDRKKLN